MKICGGKGAVILLFPKSNHYSVLFLIVISLWSGFKEKKKNLIVMILHV